MASAHLLQSPAIASASEAIQTKATSSKLRTSLGRDRLKAPGGQEAKPYFVALVDCLNEQIGAIDKHLSRLIAEDAKLAEAARVVRSECRNWAPAQAKKGCFSGRSGSTSPPKRERRRLSGCQGPSPRSQTGPFHGCLIGRDTKQGDEGRISTYKQWEKASRRSHRNHAKNDRHRQRKAT